MYIYYLWLRSIFPLDSVRNTTCARYIPVNDSFHCTVRLDFYSRFHIAVEFFFRVAAGHGEDWRKYFSINHDRAWHEPFWINKLIKWISVTFQFEYPCSVRTLSGIVFTVRSGKDCAMFCAAEKIKKKRGRGWRRKLFSENREVVAEYSIVVPQQQQRYFAYRLPNFRWKVYDLKPKMIRYI